VIVKATEQHKVKREALRGGVGSALFGYVISPGEGREGSRFQMVARIEIEPGASIGYHAHESDEEIYIILSGEGIYNDNGIEIRVRPGDTAIAFRGESHGIRNAGDDTLVFWAIIAA